MTKTEIAKLEPFITGIKVSSDEVVSLMPMNQASK
jgi:hypothetical protein